MYASLQDLIDRFGEDPVILAADRDGDGQPDPDVVDAALEDAGAEIDSYLGVAYTLPLTTVPQVIKRLTCDIAFHRLSPEADVSTEHRRSRYDEAVSLLKRIARKEVRLGLAETPRTVSRVEAISQNRRWRGRRWS